MPRYEQVRHRPAWPLDRPRAIIVACEPLRSNVNLSNLLRTAGCCGVERFICCGAAKAVAEVARDAATTVRLENHRTLSPVLGPLRRQGFQLVGLEQATGSQPLTGFHFERETVLIVGNERSGISSETLELLDAVVEIPVWGLPHAYNAATAGALALYEYCRQYPRG